MRDLDDDHVDAEGSGYGRPPKHSQFKKGQSGNPKGRPKSKKTLRTILRQITSETVTAKLPRGEKRMPVMELILRGLLQRAAKGDNRATDKLIDLVMMAFGLGEDDVKRDIAAEDRLLVQQALAELGVGKS